LRDTDDEFEGVTGMSVQKLSRLLLVLLLNQLLGSVVFAQISAQPTTNLPSAFPSETNRPVSISGRVVLEDGTALAEAVEVQRICGNVVKGDTFSDSQGKFTVFLDDKSTAAFQSASEGGGVSEMGAQMGGRASQTTRTQLWGCEVRAVLPGYVSGAVSLAGVDFSAPVTLSPIVMRKVSSGAGNSISAIALKAPKDARAEYDKGREDFSKKKYDDAEKHLAKAVDKYPQYASAYDLRGRVQRAMQKNDEAEKSFRSAIDADKEYVPPYLHLAALQASRGKWDDVVQFSDQAIKLDDRSYAEPYYFNAVAHLKLNQVAEAQKNLTKLLEVDKEHHFPKGDLMLGNILRAQGDKAAAIGHFQNYIRYEPVAADAARVKAFLQEYENEGAQAEKK
jgi:tetratricopeptide (TPR) repeat protein